MDKKALIGIGIIGAILFGWMYFSKPSAEELAKKKAFEDSIAKVQATQIAEAEKKAAALKAASDTSNKLSDTSSVAALLTDTLKADSIKAALAAKALNDKYRDFSVAKTGKEEFFVLENKLIKANISSLGGKVNSVELKNYHRPGKTEPLQLFSSDSLCQTLVINAYNSLVIKTDSLYFTAEGAQSLASAGKPAVVTMRLNTAKKGSYIDFIYKLKEDSYTLDYDVVFTNMQDIISTNKRDIDLEWAMQMPSQELHIEKEKQTSGIFYQKIVNNETDVDNLSLVSSESESINDAPLKWIAFKQQFFSSILVAKNEFLSGSYLSTYVDKTNTKVVKSAISKLAIPTNGKASETFGMQFFFGPNQYHVLRDQNMEFEKMIPMGWSIFKYLNKWLVIPIFSAFKDSTMSMGWVILILTLIIKILLFPIAYKTYLSSAKMRLLKPEIDAIKAKYGSDTMKVNQENMALYKKAGASPLSGCIPALLQLPILIALLNFFPASIELRQKEFLWATDLSTYDSIWDFGQVFIINSIYGDHVSLFALMMFVSTIIYTWMNQKMMPMNNTQMPGMQTMMYLMPLIFLSFMNSYSAGLSWYYFLANVITFGQTLLMRKFVSDEKLRAKIDEHMKKPVKKSGFQARLEQMQKQQAAARKK